jgi:hypothetical protein
VGSPQLGWFFFVDANQLREHVWDESDALPRFQELRGNAAYAGWLTEPEAIRMSVEDACKGTLRREFLAVSQYTAPQTFEPRRSVLLTVDSNLGASSFVLVRRPRRVSRLGLGSRWDSAARPDVPDAHGACMQRMEIVFHLEQHPEIRYVWYEYARGRSNMGTPVWPSARLAQCPSGPVPVWPSARLAQCPSGPVPVWSSSGGPVARSTSGPVI